MRRVLTLGLVLVTAACGAARRGDEPSSTAGAPAPGVSATASQGAATSPPRDSVTLERERYVADVRRAIAGKESLPASQVFKNVKTMGDFPAGRLLAVMNIGYGKSLGVSCTHCHVAGEWDRDDKPQKQIARDMSAMAARINNELLKPIPNLKGPNAVVNCTTCHRGQVKPALNLP